ncbi:MAG: LLM class flavin-dependent oxidoreductase [Gammaproteobacteria bacterium]|nr:LLM class flavin-dependent oxidoreductase [Gammaproteobacteria bacterium]
MVFLAKSTMSQRLPALSLAAVPGRRRATLDLAREIESRGFPAIYCPSMNDGVSLCGALAQVTERVRFGTSIQPIYTRHVQDFAQAASFIHETSGGRFDFGIGVSHAPAMDRLGVSTGKPLGDIRRFVDELRAVPRAGELPRIVLAALRQRMIGLAEEIAGGLVFANGARTHMTTSLGALRAESRADPGFFIGNMIPTVVSDDIEAAKARNRRTLASYAALPNYRAYWKEAGYEEEMNAVEQALAAGEFDRVGQCLSDRWLADTTLFGPPAQVREGIEAWFDAGIKVPIIVPSSTNGGQFRAFEEFFGIWA